MTGVWDIDGHTLERIPEVVTELPTVANGGVVNPNRTMTVTYHIREEAVWSDGVPISGDDSQFSDDRLGISPNSCNDNLTFRRAVMHAIDRDAVAVFSTTSNADIRPRPAKVYVEMMEEAGIPFEVELRDCSVFFGEMLDDQADPSALSIPHVGGCVG